MELKPTLKSYTNQHDEIKRLPTLPLIIPNTRVPPRPRSRCVAVSPRRGEQRALGRPSGRNNERTMQ
jgi:hypothetical protein